MAPSAGSAHRRTSAHRGARPRPSARDLRGVRVAVVGPALHPEHLLAPDPPHLQRVHALLRRIVGHREEDDVALTRRVVQLVEVALPPVVVVRRRRSGGTRGSGGRSTRPSLSVWPSRPSSGHDAKGATGVTGCKIPSPVLVTLRRCRQRHACATIGVCASSRSNGVRVSASGSARGSSARRNGATASDYARHDSRRDRSAGPRPGRQPHRHRRDLRHGRSERIVGRAIARAPRSGLPRHEALPGAADRRRSSSGGRSSRPRASASTPIDLYQVHWPNPLAPNGPTMHGMRRLHESGSFATSA